MTDPAHPEYRRLNQKRMAEIDAQPPEIRALVHEFNWTVVKAFLDCGVTKPKHIRHLINRVLDGASAYGNGAKPKMREMGLDQQ